MFEIIIFDDFLISPASGNYTCGMYCLTSQGVFPGEDWIDFAGILVFEWAEAIISACRFQNAHFKLPFMDGPYEIVGYRDHDTVQLEFYRMGNHHRVLEQTENVGIYELVKTMYQAVMRLKKLLFLCGYHEQEDSLGNLKDELKLVLHQMESEKNGKEQE